MRNFARFVGALTVLAAVAQAQMQAQTQTTTAFDGTYRGVSRTIEAGGRGRNRGACDPNGVPATLIIASGSARAAEPDGPMEGSVTPQGALVMRTDRGGVFQGQIDGRGSISGRMIGDCSYLFVWQKQ
jgi:hypothetical protein